MRPKDWRSFLAGAALGMIAVKLLPVVRQAAKPVARSLMVGALGLSYQAKRVAAEAREEFDTMVAEAEYQQGQLGQVQPAEPPLPAPTQGEGPDLL